LSAAAAASAPSRPSHPTTVAATFIQIKNNLEIIFFFFFFYLFFLTFAGLLFICFSSSFGVLQFLLDSVGSFSPTSTRL
jgi:hypothetical protein